MDKLEKKDIRLNDTDEHQKSIQEYYKRILHQVEIKILFQEITKIHNEDTKFFCHGKGIIHLYKIIET